MTRRTSQRAPYGFALPAVLITCLALMIVILSSMQTASSLRSSIDDQYYQRIAREAAESGATYAVSCLSKSGYVQTWTAPLEQSENCDGSAASPGVGSLSVQADTNSGFKVGDVEGRADGATIVTSVGTAQRLVDGSSTVFKTYTVTVKRIASASAVQFKGVTFGYYYSPQNGAFYVVRSADGQLLAAGSNDYGQLANPAANTDNAIKPTQVVLPTGKKAAEAYTNFLSLGYDLFVKTTDGQVWGAGLNDKGQLGNKTTGGATPTMQQFVLPDGESATYVSTLGNSTFVLTDKGNIYAAGNCDKGSLGTGCSSGSVSSPQRVALPPVTSDPNTVPDAYMVNDSRTVFVKMKGGRVYGWGANDCGQLATGDTNNASLPTKIKDFGDDGQPKATKMALDGCTFYAVDDAHNAWSTGGNFAGQMGAGLSGNNYTDRGMHKVLIPDSEGGVVDVSSDQFFATFQTTSGQVYGAGLNDAGQLGDTTMTDRNTPVRFRLPSGVSAVQTYNSSLGYAESGRLNDTFVIGDDGKVYGAGGNLYGQLGIGNNDTQAKPVPMQVIDGDGVKAQDIKYGFGTTIVLTQDGRYFTVGNNQYGQLGNGSTKNTNRPAEAQYLHQSAGSFVF